MAAQTPATLADVIGYDPWAFPRLVNPTRDLAYVIFGWTYYETVTCLTVLASARKRWKSPVYLAIAASIFFATLANTMVLIGFSSDSKVTNDLLKGPAEFVFSTIVVLCGFIAKLTYFFAALTITLAVYPTNRPVRAMLYLVAAVAAATTLAINVVALHYQRMGYDQYLLYMETGDIMTVMRNAAATVVPFLKKYFMSTALTDNVALFIFILVTNFAFLVKIYTSLAVGILDSLWSIVSTRSSQRIVCCLILAVIEATQFTNINIVGAAVSCFDKVFQVTSLTIVAFEGAAAIIKEHSSASQRVGRDSQSKSRAPSVADRHGTLARTKLAPV